MGEVEARRPLKIRDTRLANWIARTLSHREITPNQISLISIVFAALAGACLLLLPLLSGWLLPVLAAFFIQCRLLCNLFDGMVAVEGGKSTPAGELFNDIPDRIADPLILVSAGYAISAVDWGSDIGWLAGLLAVMTAYVRNLATAVGAPTNFSGPMAKQHRMALMTVACLFAAVAEPQWWPQGYIFLIALMLICIGSWVTVWRRVESAYQYLETSRRV